MTKMKTYSNRDLERLLRLFRDHLKCWKVGLYVGSLLRLEMGRHWSARLTDGSLVAIGSLTVSLDADDWTITAHGIKITESDVVTQDQVDRLIFKYFVSESLESVRFDMEHGRCTIQFTGDVTIELLGHNEEEICAITFPDGTLIGCDAKNGFNSDGSYSKAHADAYARE